MKEITILLLFVCGIGFSQNEIKTKRVVQKRDDGKYWIFDVCVNNPKIEIDQSKFYYQYNGSDIINFIKNNTLQPLLHGDWSFHNKDGSLISVGKFHLGLEDELFIKLDVNGNIEWKKNYDKGKEIDLEKRSYWIHFIEDQKHWIKFSGDVTKERGTVKKSFNSKYGLYGVEKWLEADVAGNVFTKIYKKGKIYEKYTRNFLSKTLVGEYNSFYENGRLEVKGRYYNKEQGESLRDGVWEWYNKKGELKWEEIYKVKVDKWDNGNIKQIGGFYFDKEKGKWVKNGVWEKYSKEGILEKEETEEYKYDKRVR